MKFYKLSALIGEERDDAGSGCAGSAGGALVRTHCAVPCCARGTMLWSRAVIASVAVDLMVLVFRSTQVAVPEARSNY